MTKINLEDLNPNNLPNRGLTSQIKKNNINQLKYAANDMSKIAKRMETLNPSNPKHQDNLGSAVVEASFFINAYGLAAQAFRNMVTDLNREGGDGPRGDVLFYLFEESKKFEQEIKDKKEKSEEEK